MLVFAKIFKSEDAESLLASIPAEEGLTTAILIDIPPTEGALALVKGLSKMGMDVILRDHHLPEGNSPREMASKALSTEISDWVRGGRRTRTEAPSCARLVRLSEGEPVGTLIVADKDPDGLLGAAKALGLTYSGMEEDADILDGPPSGRTKEALTPNGWALQCAWSTKMVGGAGPDEAWEELAREFISLLRGEGGVDYFTRAIDRARVAQEEATKVAATATVTTCPAGQVVEVDLRGVRVDRPTLTAILQERYPEALAIASVLDQGVIAKTHPEGVQVSLARTDYGAEKGVHLGSMTANLDGYVQGQSGPEIGVISNTPFLLHLRDHFWRHLKS